MKIYLLAGEASGDIHGASLVNQFNSNDPKNTYRGMGGDEMKRAGCEVTFDYKAFSVMGFVEVIVHYRKIRRYFIEVEKDIRSYNPDIIIFIDFPGFNLRLAKKLYNDYSLHYYIAPKAWAWNANRVKQLKRYMTSVSCILPFEESFFRSHDINAKYVGNPSKEQVENYQENNSKVESEKNYIALFPGSRNQEINRILPVMLEAVRNFPAINYKISKAANLPKSLYAQYITTAEELVEDNYTLLANADGALVTSGTATLETALFGIPQVVCYIANPISYFIAKRLVKLRYISLVNLIMNKEVVLELIQQECTVDQITKSLAEILDAASSNKIKMEYQGLSQKLGTKKASQEAVKFILASIK